MVAENYEEVNVYPLEPDVLERLLNEQSELCFMWSTKDAWAVGFFMSYVWKDGSFWVTATSQRARMRALERDGRVSVSVTSVGTSLGPSKSATVKGRVRFHHDEETKRWFYPALAERVVPGMGPITRAFAALLNSERRVIIEVVPEKWMTFDASKMMVDTAAAMVRSVMPENVKRGIAAVGIDPEALARFLAKNMPSSEPRASAVLRGMATRLFAR